MPRTNLKDRIKEGLFLLDGAMGTQLIAHGIEPGTCYDYLNIKSPDIVCDIHRAYLQVGSDAILTNTFGANKFALARHGLAKMVEKINTTGAQIARQAASEQKHVLSKVEGYVLGDIGPTGDFLEPLGNLKPDELKVAFAQQAKALAAGGVDGFIIETMTALDEATIAVEAVKTACELPIFVSFAFDKTANDFRTMMGVDIQSFVSKIVPLGIDAIGFNCGSATLDDYVELAKKFVSEIMAFEKKRATSDKQRATILAEPNAGKPELIDGKAVYKVTPEDFALAAQKIYSAGITIIGGCCGTSPGHIKAMTQKLKIKYRR